RPNVCDRRQTKRLSPHQSLDYAGAFFRRFAVDGFAEAIARFHGPQAEGSLLRTSPPWLEPDRLGPKSRMDGRHGYGARARTAWKIGTTLMNTTFYQSAAAPTRSERQNAGRAGVLRETPRQFFSHSATSGRREVLTDRGRS